MLETLGDIDGTDERRRPKWWPKSPRSLSVRLRRLAPDLRRTGIDIQWRKESSGERRRLVQVRIFASGCGFASETGENPDESADAKRHAGQAANAAPDANDARTANSPLGANRQGELL